MLALLNEIGSWPSDFSAIAFARHPHATVRREALLLATRLRREREAAIGVAVADTDERVMRIGINAARESGLPAAAVPVVLERLLDPELSSDLVVALVRLLSRHDQPDVRERLLSLVVLGRRTFFRRPRLLPRSPEMVASLTSLATMRSEDARVRDVLELARKSRDSVVRAAVEGAPA
jgi:hypothetical protein